ncbi:hypothetical protein HPP92_028741 [Vanilla planifolia]|uniref:Uncharacterized protein n=1 Tax=Vanilla planifolia TaxID=51239 RepID=A0A835P7K1_VANPL|nr:hypothetical protein HPP92_028741 [Vanilla planifolia]KAG0446672.1 hypothetical protein HPP92_028730 [Vanilla planifolia]
MKREQGGGAKKAEPLQIVGIPAKLGYQTENCARCWQGLLVKQSMQMLKSYKCLFNCWFLDLENLLPGLVCVCVLQKELLTDTYGQ